MFGMRPPELVGVFQQTKLGKHGQSVLTNYGRMALLH